MNTIENHSEASTDRKAWRFIQALNAGHPERTAIEDGTAKYTYAEMFRQWEQYAAVFSALGMTGVRQTRAGLIGSTSAEAVFAFYGLNMVGAQTSLIAPFCMFDRRKVVETIQNEKLTDILLTDDYAQPDLIYELLMRQQELGLRHVLLLHIPSGGAAVGHAVTAYQEQKAGYLKKFLAPIYMDTLLRQYAGHPVLTAPDSSQEAAVILHTSGTTSGTGKPLPHSDHSFNHAGNLYNTLEEYAYLKENMVCGVTIDLSNAYGLINQVHAAFAVGGTIVTVPGCTFNPLFYKAVAAHHITLLFCTAAILSMWEKEAILAHPDFSSVRLVVVGGAAVSAKEKQHYTEFLQKHGAKDFGFINGYGLGECGGACILSSPDVGDESIGRLIPGFELRLYDEDAGVYHAPGDAPCSGVMYLHADSMTSGELDGKVFVKTELIDGKPYICTNDYVQLDTGQKITYLGRANRYFVNDEKIHYESGRVEAETAKQPGIRHCVTVPVYNKFKHDNIPMLCIEPEQNDCTAVMTARNALVDVFVKRKALDAANVPHRVMLLDELPRNQNGKFDIYKITSGIVTGACYTVEAVRFLGSVTDIRLIPLKEGSDDMLSTVLREMQSDIQQHQGSAGCCNSMNAWYGQMMQMYAAYYYQMYSMYYQQYMQQYMRMAGMYGNPQKG